MAELDFEKNNWVVGEANLVHQRNTAAIEQFETDLRQNGITDTSWVSELIVAAGNPKTGQAYLDRRIPEIVAASPEGFAYTMQRRLNLWYLFFGFVDRYYEIIFELDLTDKTWSDADDMINTGTIHRHLGFTAHPKYLVAAEKLGYIDVWEQRGPPDFCRKTGDKWACE